MGKKTPVDYAGPRIEMAQIEAELAQDRHTIDPRTSAQVFHTLKPMLGDLPSNWLSGLELAHQKAIQVNENFLGARILSTSGTPRLKKCLKPKGQRTSKKACCHSQPFLGHGIDTSRRAFRSALA